MTDWRGVGFLSASTSNLDFSAHHFSISKLSEARHTHELVDDEFITVNVDHAQNGLGTASVGPVCCQCMS
jgi:beta-galactosidase